MHKSPRPEETSAKRGGTCRHGHLQRTGMDWGTVGRAESTPGARPRRTPALKKARRGRRNWILGSAGLWRPRGSLVPASSDGTLPAASTTALRDPLRGRPLRSGLRGAFSALRARPARSGRGADVFRLPPQAPCGALRKRPCSRGGRPSRTPPSARRGTASPPPASDGPPRPRDAPRDAGLSVLQEPRSVPLEGSDRLTAPEGPRVDSSDA
jgi:hypothetical protein